MVSPNNDRVPNLKSIVVNDDAAQLNIQCGLLRLTRPGVPRPLAAHSPGFLQWKAPDDFIFFLRPHII